MKSLLSEKVFAIYVNVGNIDDNDVKKYMTDFRDKFDSFKDYDNVITMFIPVRNSETRIERVY